MCEYSLMGVKNRLAKEGEGLTTHRFCTGTIGLASVADVNTLQAWQAAQNKTGIMARIRLAFNKSKRPVVCAVCVPPGAILQLDQDEGRLRRVTFVQLSMQVNGYRDAIRFKGGHAKLLQILEEGTRMTVISLADTTEREPVREGRLAYASR